MKDKVIFAGNLQKRAKYKIQSGMYQLFIQKNHILKKHISKSSSSFEFLQKFKKSFKKITLVLSLIKRFVPLKVISQFGNSPTSHIRIMHRAPKMGKILQ